MHKMQSIGFKLFLALTLTALGAVLALAIMFWLSFGVDFKEYVARLELTHLDSVENVLLERYQQHNDWSFVHSPRDIAPTPFFAEHEPMKGRDPMGSERFPPPHNQVPPPDNSDNRGRPPHMNGAGGPERADVLDLGRRLALFNASGELIMGRIEARSQPRRTLVNNAGVTIGYLALAPLPDIDGINEQHFIASQARSMLLSCLIAVFISALAAFALAKYFRKPIAALAEGARQLAAGQLHTRVLLNRNDELNELAQDFNLMAQKLERFEQARRQWVADTSHELRTPLTILRAHTDAMRDGVMPLDQRGLARIESATVDLERLVADLYQLARSDIGIHDYLMEKILLPELFVELNEKFIAPMKQAGLTFVVPDFTLTPAKMALVINGDYGQLMQLFSNLLNNSLRYTAAGGSVVITATSDSGRAEIILDDSAPGVPESALPHLFERFYRVDASHNRRTGGSGLGLSICEAMVLGHAGNISAAQSPLGGLRIRLTFPLLVVK